MTETRNALHATQPSPLTHVALRTRDLDASIAFYRRYAGLHCVHERCDDGIRVAWLGWRERDPEFVIVLLEMPHERALEPAACDHLGFAALPWRSVMSSNWRMIISLSEHTIRRTTSAK